MSDTGSDSDATVAEEVNEENANSDSSDDSSIHTVEVLHPDCAVSLQRRQKLLFEKITSETSGVQYVQELQEEYLILEESLRQLSKTARQERKQLSDELEAASTTGTSCQSFQRQLIQLSDKQKALLQCFDCQKTLGSKLKVLLSNQNHYSTRSKVSLQQVHSQNSSGFHRNSKPPNQQVEPPKVTTCHFKPAQPVSSPIKLPPPSQLTTAAIALNKSTVSDVTSLGIAEQQKSVGVMTKNQQPQSIMTNQQKLTSAKSQKIVGVAPQQQKALNTDTDQHPEGVAKQRVMDEATSKQTLKTTNTKTQPTTITPHQQKPVGVAQQSVDVTTQQKPSDIVTQQQSCSMIAQKQSVGMAVQKQSVGVAQQQMGIAAQQHPMAVQQQPVGVAAQQQQMVDVITQSMEIDHVRQTSQPEGGALIQHTLGAAQQLVSVQQSRGVATKQQWPVTKLLHSELAQPVPLDVLVRHHLISPQDQCLTCTLMGCQFTGSLTSDGNIVSQDGHKFSNPPQWLNSCWATLGHSKRVDRRTAYSKVNYRGKSLLHYCLVYSQQKVSSYLNRSHDQTPTHPVQKTRTCREDVIDMTDKCYICPISDQELVLSNECLPTDFWECSIGTVLVNSEMESDLNFN